MKVSMNGLRRNMAHAFNEFAIHQKEMLEKDEFDSITVYEYQKDENTELLAKLRMHIANLMICYEPGDEDFRDLSDEIQVVEIGEGE